MKSAIVALGVSAALVGARETVAQTCVNSVHGYTTYAAKVSINTDSSLQNAGADAAAMWNQCGGLPLMAANDDLDAVPIDVTFHWGESPLESGACGNGVADVGWNQVVGGTINIWERWGQGAAPHLRGQLCTDNWGALIAHEVGHVLGLGNSTCPGYLMGPSWATCLGPATGECGAAGSKWITPEEQKEICDLSCSSGECVDGPASGPRWVCPDTSGDPGSGDGGDPGCTWGACSPLVLDLNGDGIHTPSALVDPVLFDLTGDGLVDVVGWTHPATEEALLYYDHDLNGIIDGGAELFGEATILPDGQRAQNGFEALAAYDRPANGGNGDDVISPADRVWGRMRLWVDRNHDGRMTNDENYSLSQAGVVQLDLTYEQANAEETYGIDAAGNYHVYRGSFVQRERQSRTVRALHDVYFVVNAWSDRVPQAPDQSLEQGAIRTGRPPARP